MPSCANSVRSRSRRACPVSSSWSTYLAPTRATVHSGPAQSSSFRGERGVEVTFVLRGRAVEEPLERGQRLGDDLIHVVVAVGGEAADEDDLALLLGELPVLLV